MSDIEKEINNCVSEIEHKIESLNAQKEYLKNLDFSKKPSEEEWYSMMNTGIRYSPNIVEKLITNLYPDAKDINLGCNYVKFTLQGIKCGISISNCREASIFEDKRDKGSTYKELTRDEINNIKEVANRLSEFTKRVNVCHFYRDKHNRLQIEDVPFNKFVNVIEKYAVQESEIEK